MLSATLKLANVILIIISNLAAVSKLYEFLTIIPAFASICYNIYKVTCAILKPIYFSPLKNSQM